MYVPSSSLEQLPQGCLDWKTIVQCKYPLVGECSKCGIKVKRSRCGQSIAARLIIEDDGGKEYRVMAFNEVVEDVVRDQAGADFTEKLVCVLVMRKLTQQPLPSSFLLDLYSPLPLLHAFNNPLLSKVVIPPKEGR